MSPVRAILWDADGVLQHPPSGWNWRAELERVGGPGVSDIVFEAELPSLRGEEPMRDALARLLFEHPHTPLEADDLIGLWEMTDVDPSAMALVDDLRRRGMACHLATNQQDHRRAWMRDVLGYDRHFDRVYYSCEMGVVKPDRRARPRSGRPHRRQRKECRVRAGSRDPSSAPFPRRGGQRPARASRGDARIQRVTKRTMSRSSVASSSSKETGHPARRAGNIVGRVANSSPRARMREVRAGRAATVPDRSID